MFLDLTKMFIWLDFERAQPQQYRKMTLIYKRKLLKILNDYTEHSLVSQSEIETLNRPDFKWRVNWLQVLQQLIEEYQDAEDDVSRQTIERWLNERDQLR